MGQSQSGGGEAPTAKARPKKKEAAPDRAALAEAVRSAVDRTEGGGQGSGDYGSLSHAGHGHQDFEHETFNWEHRTNPWMLFFNTGINLGKNVAALAIVYWTLLMKHEYMMACDGRIHSTVSVYACEYTKAYIRAFPLLAANVSLIVGWRVLLQQRVYYGMLKAGGLLDFTNVRAAKDPLVIILAVSLVHGLAHFVLKFSTAWFSASSDAFFEHRKLEQEMQVTFSKFLVPCFIFMAFFYGSYDVEKTLIPLSKYFEEDPEYAQRALGRMKHLEEHVVRYEVVSRDVVGAVGDRPTVQKVYHRLIDSYATAKDEYPKKQDSSGIFEWRLFYTLWPASLLVDPRLEDAGSRSFRHMTMVFLLLAILLEVATVVAFLYQAYHNVVIDYWVQGEREDLCSFAVSLLHAGFILWLLIASVRSAFAFGRRSSS